MICHEKCKGSTECLVRCLSYRLMQGWRAAMLCSASHPSFKLGFNKPLNTLFLHYQAMSSKLMLRGTSAAHLQAHFRFGFFVAAALAPDALSCYGASLVAGLAAGRFEPANVPLFPLVALVSVAFTGPLRPSFDPAAALFSLLLE